MKLKSISQYFHDDQDRLRYLLHEFQRMKLTDFLRARENFVAFQFGLQRHIVWEEDILFPVFEQKTGLLSKGPTQVMRTEHRKIVELLTSIQNKTQKFDRNTDEEERRLLALLEIHNLKEENILYPALDEFVTEAEQKEIYEAIKKTPDERYLFSFQSV